ncbi:MAG: acyltransferase [Acidovorax sp.]
MRDKPSFEAYRAKQRFGSLDGLRALSIVAVMWHHSGGPEVVEILKRGQLGVHLFFAISGFLITTLLIREKDRYGEISIRNFFLRRSLRIFPLYYAILTVYVIVVLVIERGSQAGQAFLSNLPYFLTYTTNWFVDYKNGERTIFYFAWSLATEEQFYIVFPWLVAFTSKRTTTTALASVLTIAYLAQSSRLFGLMPENSFLGKLLWNIAPCIILGALAAITMHSRRGFNAMALIFGHRISFPIVLAVIALVANMPKGGISQEYVIFLLLVALVISAVLREDHMLANVLRARWIARIGMISYGMYLMHLLCFHASDLIWKFTGWPKWVGHVTLGLALTILMAEISFRTFEAWFLRRKARFSPMPHFEPNPDDHFRAEPSRDTS